MSKRFFLVLGLGVLMALTGVVLSLRPDLLGHNAGEAFDPGQGTPAGAEDGSPRPQRRARSPRTGRPVPAARIAVNGQGQDWQRIEQSLRCRLDVLGTSVYRCTSVEFARDAHHLYAKLELARGVGQRFRHALARTVGRPVSGNLDDLEFSTEGLDFSLRIATGYCVIRGPAPFKPLLRPTVRLVVFRRDPRLAPVFSAGSKIGQPENHVAFDGKIIELRLPLASLGLRKAARVEVVTE